MKFPKVSTGDHGRQESKAKTHASTGEGVLQQLIPMEKDPERKCFLESLSEYRKLSKIKSTYMEPMQAAAENIDRKSTETYNAAPPKAIFCQWNQCAVGTGRLSTCSPNLQSLPRGTKEIEDIEIISEQNDENEINSRVLHEINIRGCFRPANSSKLFLSADFNQMEMRILAHYSQDKALRDFFSAGGINDVYKFMASLCFDCDQESVTSQQRTAAKTLSLGISYGMGPELMASKLTRFTKQTYTKSAAQKLIEIWNNRMAGVQKFMSHCRTEARTKKEIRTYAGRLRRLPDISSKNHRDVAYSERQSINSCIQGTASDLCKRAMILIHDNLLEFSDNQNGEIASLCLQLHDEIVIEVDESWIFVIADTVKKTMEKVFIEASIPFPVSLKAGKALGQLNPITEEDINKYYSAQQANMPNDYNFISQPISNNSQSSQSFSPNGILSTPASANSSASSQYDRFSHSSTAANLWSITEKLPPNNLYR